MQEHGAAYSSKQNNPVNHHRACCNKWDDKLYKYQLEKHMHDVENGVNERMKRIVIDGCMLCD